MNYPYFAHGLPDRSVAYYYDDGTALQLKPGITSSGRPWRGITWTHRNPGGITGPRSGELTDLNRRDGAIGVVRGFLVFPSRWHGKAAQWNLIARRKAVHYNQQGHPFFGKYWRELTFAEMLTEYSPSSDGNRPRVYAERLQQLTGLPIFTRKIYQYSAADFSRVLDAMARVEAWRPGEVWLRRYRDRAGNIKNVNTRIR